MTNMMRNCIFLSGLFVCLAAASAGAQKNEPAPGATPSTVSGPIRFKKIRLQNEDGNDCQYGGQPAPCVRVDIEYPEVASAPNETAKIKINRAIQQWVLEEFGGAFRSNTIYGDPEALLKGLIDAHEGQGFGIGWWVKREIKVEYESANVLSLSREGGGYRGGAHENGRVDYANFRPSTGEPIRLRDILKPGFEKPLNSIGEVRFRALENLGPKASLRENNFDFPDDQFQLNDNFFIDAKGLTFQYNSYEVNCFACGGPPTVFLPYSDLRTLLRPDAHIP